MSSKAGYAPVQVIKYIRDFLKYKVAMDNAKGIKTSLSELIIQAVESQYKDELKAYKKLLKDK